jgi:osmotically-inducible protein OsmY
MESAMRSDVDIRRDVEDELQYSPNIDDTNIAVAVKQGTVELAGFVKRFMDKYEAEMAAKRVAGVVGLANDIEVRVPQHDQRPDADIARDAVVAIQHWVPAGNVRPIIRNGWVTLEGDVQWHFQSQDAQDAVRRLKGVRNVTNEIQIKPHADPHQVKSKIEEAFKRNAAFAASQIMVDAIGGDVTLKGSVRSWAERQQAETAAWAAPGVTNVDDRLNVGV